MRLGSPRWLNSLAVLWWLAIALAPARADEYPQRPIRLIVPFSPGTSSDIGARRLGQGLEKVLGQPVVIENITGAGGIVGVQRAARAEADGYTLLIGTIGTHAVNVAIYKSLPYDPIGSFEAITRFISFPNILVVNPSVNARSLPELVALARDRSKSGHPLSYASGGSGTSAHLGGEQFKRAAGVELVHVPYKGAAAGIPDLLGGRVDILFGNISIVVAQVASGTLVPLVNTGSSRSSLMADVPTVAEAGMPELELSNWLGLFAPAGTPPARLDRLRLGVHSVLADPAIQAAFAQDGTDVVEDASGQAFKSFIEGEISKWIGVAKAANIEAQ